MLESCIFRLTSATFLPKTNSSTIVDSGDLVLECMGSSEKDCFQPLVNRISIKLLEKY